MPSITAKEAKQSAWLVPILASGAGFFALWLIVKLGERFPGQNLIQYSPKMIGEFLGKLLGIGYIFYFLVFNILIMRQFTEVINISLLENTPIWFISISFVLLASYGSYSGLEVIARSAQFVLPLVAVSSFSIILFSFQDLEIKQLFPLFEGGVGPLMKASFVPATWFSECVILAFLLPFINKPKKTFRKSSWALIASTIFFSVEILLALLLLGPELAGSFDISFWKVIRFIEVGRTLLRIETVIIFLWISVVVIKFTLILYLGSFTIAEVFGWKSCQPVILPYGLVIAAISSVFVENTMELNKVLSVYWPIVGLFFGLVAPSILLGVAWLFKKGRKHREKKNS